MALLPDGRRFFDFAQNDTSLAVRQPIVGTPKGLGIGGSGWRCVTRVDSSTSLRMTLRWQRDSLLLGHRSVQGVLSFGWPRFSRISSDWPVRANIGATAGVNSFDDAKSHESPTYFQDIQCRRFRPECRTWNHGGRRRSCYWARHSGSSRLSDFPAA